MKPQRSPYRTTEHVCVICGAVIRCGDGAVRELERIILDQHPTLRSYKFGLSHQHCFQAWHNKSLYVRLFNKHHREVDGDEYLSMKRSGAVEQYVSKDESSP